MVMVATSAYLGRSYYVSLKNLFPTVRFIYPELDIPGFNYNTRCFPSTRKIYETKSGVKYTRLEITVGSITHDIDPKENVSQFASLENFLGTREALRILPLPIANEILLHF